MNKERKYLQLILPMDLYNRLKTNMEKHGFTSVSPFIRYVLIKFLDKYHD